ncbi:MAG: serine hydrolase [Pseudomonadota bacterium]
MTKTVSSLLIGQALGERKIGSTADTLRTLLPSEIGRTSNAFAADISLQQVLDMRSGQKWDESVRQRDATTAPDMTAFALALPSDGSARGTKFEYSTATSHLLSPILSNAYRMDELAVATNNLFQPMGIKQAAWSRDASGMIHGSFGLQMRTRDLMKLAWMAHDGGRWQGRSVVPASWLAENLQPHVTGLGDNGRLRNVGYGNMWWHGTLGGHKVVLGWGYGGQHALIVPGLNMTIATACELNVSYGQADENEDIIIDLIARFLLQLTA